MRDSTAKTPRTALAISARALRHGSGGINRRADVFEPRWRTKTGGEENGDDNKSISERFARSNHKTFIRRPKEEIDCTAISRHAGVRNGAAFQQRLLEQSRRRDLR